MSTADKLQQLRLERQKSDLSHKLQALQGQLERAEGEKNALAEESGNKIKQALSLLDNARKEIDKLKKDKEALTREVTELRRRNENIISGGNHGGNHGNHGAEQENGGHKESRSTNGTSNMGEGVVVRRRPKDDEGGTERPMSMAERMSMFEKKGPGRSFGTSPSITNGAARTSWRNPPQVNLSAEDTSEETSPVTKRPGRVTSPVTKRPGRVTSPVPKRPDKVPSPVSKRPDRVPVSQRAKDNRHTMPPNAYSTKQVLSPTPAPNAAASGRTKMRTAVGGMMAAIDTEKKHKGIGPKPTPQLANLVNTIAPPKTPLKKATSLAAPGSAASKKAALLHWCQRMCEDKTDLEIKNFGSSWNNGMAFCALFHRFVPNQIPYESLNPANREENFTLAFREGEKAGVTALLDVEDMMIMKNPDWMSVMTYVSLIYNHFNGIRVGGPRLPPMPGQE